MDLMGAQEVRWGTGGTEPADDYTLPWKWNDNYELATGFVYSTKRSVP